jgi:hypothetical protein
MQRHYRKEIPESSVFIAGHPMRFDILETEDPMLIAELDKCVARGIGGVIQITPEEYAEEVKKKEQWKLLNSSSKPQHRQEISALRLDARRVVEAVGNPSPKIGQFAKPQIPTDGHRLASPPKEMPEPIEVPSPDSFVIKPPPTMRASDVKTKAA